ncbi:CidA/LrgA family protein [Arenibaculum pallidiluteum]|uniref:CidA/LrgA family protein n=1 Tax=Arenibaculum pallidiluteum TaxID=2812559 RepID=UPI001A96BADE|nr:CidA/LrgA family protein [Arenibaculum pallidiluteum]
MTAALLTLLGCQLAGEILAHLLALPVPGPVLGMVLLASALALQPRAPEALRRVSGALLRHLSLLFVPAGVGLVQHGPRLAAEGTALAVALVVSTVASIAVAAVVFRAVARLTGDADDAS